MNPQDPNQNQPGDDAAEWSRQPTEGGQSGSEPQAQPPHQPPTQATPQSGPQSQAGYGVPGGGPGYGGPEGQTAYIPTAAAAGYQAGGWTGQNPPAPGTPQPPQQPPFQQQPQGFPAGPMPPGYPPQQRIPQLPLQVWLIIASVIPGIIVYFMGLLPWVTIDDTVDLKAQEWAEGLGNSVGLPGYLSPILVLNPGYFLILLGVVAVASVFVALPVYRRFVPLIAIGAVIGWLGLLACALAVPPFIPLGSGAITALVLGAVQMALLVGATVMHGLGRDR